MFQENFIYSTDLAGKTHMRGTSLIRTVAGEVNSTKSAPPIRRHLTSGLQSAQKKNITSGRYHPIPSNPHVVTIKNEKAEMQNSYPHNFDRFVVLSYLIFTLMFSKHAVVHGAVVCIQLTIERSLV